MQKKLLNKLAQRQLSVELSLIGSTSKALKNSIFKIRKHFSIKFISTNQVKNKIGK